MKKSFIIFALAFSLAFPAIGSKKRCPNKVALISVDDDCLFGPRWDAPDKFLSNFKAFSRILTLADGETLEHSREIARAYPKTYVMGSDLEAILPDEEGAPEYREDLKRLPNLAVLQIDVNRPIDLPDGAAELVYLYAGLCHCKDKRRACCGVPLQGKEIARFLREIWRLVDKNVSHSMAFLHGYLPEPYASPWLKTCIGLEKEQKFQCVPQFGPRAALWGFKLKQLR